MPRPATLAALLALCLAHSLAAQRADVGRLRDTVGMILDAGVRDSVFPGAMAVIGTRDGVLVARGTGHLDWAPSPAPNDSTLWDLASLTKVVGLTTAVMQLTEQGRVDLDAPVARYIPEFSGGGKEQVLVRHLLTHSGGVRWWRPLYREVMFAEDSALTRAERELVAAVAAAAQDCFY